MKLRWLSGALGLVGFLFLACTGDDPDVPTVIVLDGGPTSEGGTTTPTNNDGEAPPNGETGAPYCTGAVCNDVKQLSAGGGAACALKNDGTVWCWGDNTTFQLGTSAALETCGTLPCSTAPQRIGGLDRIKAISLGGWHACALRDDKTVWCWGSNKSFQLGHEEGASDCTATNLRPCEAKPRQVVGLEGVDQISAGYAHTCARIRSEVKCWGGNSNFGALGGGVQAGNSSAPVKVLGLPATGIEEIAASAAWSCARAGNQVFCWGENTAAQQGHPTSADTTGGGPRVVDSNAMGPFALTPQLATLGAPTTGIRAMFLGSNTACLFVGTRTVRCWGSNYFGEMADTTTTDHPSDPSTVDIKFAGNENIASVALGLHHGCALSEQAKLACWGDTSLGQAGTSLFRRPGVVSTNCQSPMALCTGGSADVAGSWKLFAVGLDFTVAVSSDNKVMAWGNNKRGVLGHLPGTSMDETCQSFTNPNVSCNPKPTSIVQLP